MDVNRIPFKNGKSLVYVCFSVRGRIYSSETQQWGTLEKG